MNGQIKMQSGCQGKTMGSRQQKKAQLIDFMIITKNAACRMCGGGFSNGANTTYQVGQSPPSA